MEPAQKVPGTLVLLFTALLPLKFTQIAGTPSVPAFYWGDLSSLLYCGWSMHIFSLTAALLFAFALLLHAGRNTGVCKLKYLLLWAIAGLISLLGIINASCTEYVRQTLNVLFGYVCYAGAVALMLEQDEHFPRRLLGALWAGMALAAFSGWEQICGGLDATRAFAGGQDLSEAMLRQLDTNRIFGPFPICNIFAGCLAAVLPLTLARAWLWAKEHAKPVLPSQILLGGFWLAALGVPLWMTGSRGAVLALAFSVFAVLFIVLKNTKKRLILAASAVLAGLALIALVIFRRGADSAVFRLDYDFAAFRMMLAHPFAGIGWGDFYHDYPALKLLLNDELPRSPHNFALFFGSQCGVAGFLAALALLAFPVVTAFRHLRTLAKAGDRDKLLSFAALTASLCTITVDSLLEIGIECPAFTGMLIVFALCVLHEAETSSLTVRARFAVPLLPPVLAAAVMAGSEIRREMAFADLFERTRPAFSRTPDLKPPDSELRSAFEQAKRIAPGNPFIYAEMAKFGRDPLESDALISEAIRLDPKETGFYRTRIRIRKTPDETGSDLIRLKALDPKGELVRSKR